MTGQPTKSRIHGYPANFATYRDYHVLVYGHPAQVPGNRYDAVSRQHAVLGFSYDEFKVTNTRFPDDAPGGISLTTPFDWIELPQGSKATLSWSRLNEAQKRHLKMSQLTYRNETYGYMDFTSLGLDESNTVVLAPPSWHLGSAIYTQHDRPGVPYKEVRYATFYTSGGGDVTLTCRIELRAEPDKDGFYTFESGQDTLRIPYRAIGTIESYEGLARSEDITVRGVGTADGLTYGTGDGPFLHEGVLTVERTALGNADEMDQPIIATTFVVSALGDVITSEATIMVPIRAEKPVAPLLIDADLEGAIGFFSGSRMLNGSTPLASKRRFLGLETVWLKVRFSKPLTRWQFTFLGKTKVVELAEPAKDSRVAIRMPLDQSSLTWHDERIRPSLLIEIKASDPERADAIVTTEITGIELTGDVFDLLYLQLAD